MLTLEQTALWHSYSSVLLIRKLRHRGVRSLRVTGLVSKHLRPGFKPWAERTLPPAAAGRKDANGGEADTLGRRRG